VFSKDESYHCRKLPPEWRFELGFGFPEVYELPRHRRGLDFNVRYLSQIAFVVPKVGQRMNSLAAPRVFLSLGARRT
jgi:hypothetical protein